VDASHLTFFGYGVLFGLAVACLVAFGSWRRHRDLDREVRRLHSHLHDQMEINHEGSKQLKLDLVQLRLENENLRVTLQAWKQKPDRRELHLLIAYDDAIRRVVTTVPGFAPYWETALREAEESLARADRGLLAFARRLLPRSRKPPVTPPEEGSDE
jgi:hypothetical protein